MLEAHLLGRLIPSLPFSEIFEWQKRKCAELDFADEWRIIFVRKPLPRHDFVIMSCAQMKHTDKDQ